MNHSDAINIQVQLASFAIAIAASSTYEQSQQEEIFLLEVFGSNEEGRRSMTKSELETLSDTRYQSALRSAQQQIRELERRVASTEAELARQKALLGTTETE